MTRLRGWRRASRLSHGTERRENSDLPTLDGAPASSTAFGLSAERRGELSYLAPLGSENISAPYFKQCFFRWGEGITPQTVKHHASQSQDRNNKYFILYIEFCINNKI